MKFLADVNIPLPLIKLLTKRGYEVSDARIEYSSAKDIQLIKIAKENNLIIITKDKDFLELTKYPKYKIPLIAVRLTNQKTANIVSHVEELLNNYSEEILLQSITVIYEDIAESFPLE